MKISIAIPCYEIDGSGYELIDYSLDIITNQTFKDFEVIVSDQSLDDKIKNICNKWSKDIDIKYYKNIETRGSCPANTNNAIKKCNGEIIKILFQDDYLLDTDSLEKTIREFDNKTSWLATSYLHSYDRKNYFNYHIPKMNNKIYIENTIGTPSCISIRNTDLIYLDENLHCFCDCEYYKRLFDKFGNPTILYSSTMINYLWKGQLTNSDFIKNKFNEERQKVINMYEIG